MRKAIFVLLAACGGGDDPPAGIDAPGSIDAAPPTVVTVTPCVGEAITVDSTAGFAYVPRDSNITQGQIVKFVNRSDHDVAPLPPMTDSGLRVPLGGTACLRFTATGTFNFKCTPHGFSGSITVN